ncbi:MAG: hypothetical protein QOF23_584 [Solirubrobacterales bacterium]|nr:hypothetical protein [Solirubrobacterales bacterium]
MASAEELIRGAIGRVQNEVPALEKLKLVFGLELPARGDVQVFRVELPGPKIKKGFSDDERLRLSIPRSMFNILATEGEVADWREAFEHGHLKVEGNPKVQQLIGQVIDKATARAHLRKTR